MPRKSASKAASTPKTPATSEGTPSRRGNRTPAAKKPAETVEAPSSEPKRSRRSSTAVQTAASQAESRRTRSHSNRSSSQSPVGKSSSRDEGADANTSSASRSTRRPMKKVNYEESEGEEDTADKTAQPEEDYNAEDDAGNDSDSLEASSKKENQKASPPTRGSSKKQSGGSGSPRVARSSRKKKKEADEEDDEAEGEEGEEEAEAKDKAEDVADAPAAAAPTRRGRYSTDKDEKPKEGTRSRRSAGAAAPKATPQTPPARPTRAARQQKSANTEKEEPAKPVRSSNRSSRRSKAEEPKEDEAEKMEESNSEQKSETEETERKRKLDADEGEDEADGGQKSKKMKLEESKELDTETRSTEKDEVVKDVEDTNKDESNSEEPMEVNSEAKESETEVKENEEKKEPEKDIEEGEESSEAEKADVVEEKEEEEIVKDEEDEKAPAAKAEEKIAEDVVAENEVDKDNSGEKEEAVAESITDEKPEADVEKSVTDEPAEEEDEPAEEEEEEEEPIEDEAAVVEDEEEPVEDEEEAMEEDEPLVEEPGGEKEAPKTSEPVSLASSKDEVPGLSNVKDNSPKKSVPGDDLINDGQTPVVSDSTAAVNQESSQSGSVKTQDSVNGTPAPDQLPKDVQQKSEPTQMLPSSAIELNQQQQHSVPSKPEPEIVRISANGHVADDKALNAEVTAKDFSSWLLHGRPYFTNRSPCAEALSRHSERTFGIVSLNLESTKVDDQFLLELKKVSSEVVCMQGLSAELFHQKLEPALTGLGYKGTFAQDEGRVVATFYKASVFQLKSQKSLPLKQTIGKDLEHGLPPGERSAVAEKLPVCGQVLFTYLSLTQSTRGVAVANVLVPPSDVSTQALQMSCLAREAVAFLESRGTGGGVPLVLCGAFNMLQQEAAYQLLRDGYLSNEMIEILQSKKELKLPGREEDTSLVNLLWKSFQHSASGLKSCYSAVTGKEFEFGSQGSTRTSPDLIWFSSDSLTPIGVLQAPPSPTGHHLLLKADLAFNY